MKVTSKTGCVKATLSHCIGEVSIEYSPDSREPISRVVEFPKVWREGGKQYKVTYCQYCHNGDTDDKVTIKAPRSSWAYAHFCTGTIEYY